MARAAIAQNCYFPEQAHPFLDEILDLSEPAAFRPLSGRFLKPRGRVPMRNGIRARWSAYSRCACTRALAYIGTHTTPHARTPHARTPHACACVFVCISHSACRLTGKWDYAHIPYADAPTAHQKGRFSLFQPSWVLVCPWLVCRPAPGRKRVMLCRNCTGLGCVACSRLYCMDCVHTKMPNSLTRGSHTFKKEAVVRHMKQVHAKKK